MTRRIGIVGGIVVCGFMMVGLSAAAPPNILIILADDMGYGDLGCMGSKFLETPQIDALAKSGVLCSQAYVASAVCSPSRAGLLTGRDPRRFGYQANLNAAAANYATRPDLLGLPPGEHTLGDHLRAAGYATAIIGKWHQGTGAPFHPNARGFDYFCGMLGGGHPYFPDVDTHKIERNGKRVKEFSSPYLTDFFTDEALRWLAGQRTSGKPWFLYLAYNAPHTPLQAKDEDLARFARIQDKRRRTYAAMVYALDRGVGRLCQFLKQTDQVGTTLVVFFSDNGGATNNGSWNGPLTGVKGSLHDGGIRVPMIWSWPGRLPEGVYDSAAVSSLDLLPTFMTAAEAKPLPLAAPRRHEDKRNRKRMVARYGAYDGINLLPLLRGESVSPTRMLFWRLQGQAAVLQGADKLIRLSHRPAQMFKPASDVAEQQDLAATDPERLARLFKELGDWESTLPTVPLWGSSPFWDGQSAKDYDAWRPRPEPK